MTTAEPEQSKATFEEVLATTRVRYMTDGTVWVEPEDLTLLTNLLFSPDRGDSLMMSQEATESGVSWRASCSGASATGTSPNNAVSNMMGDRCRNKDIAQWCSRNGASIIAYADATPDILPAKVPDLPYLDLTDPSREPVVLVPGTIGRGKFAQRKKGDGTVVEAEFGGYVALGGADGSPFVRWGSRNNNSTGRVTATSITEWEVIAVVG